MNAPSHAQAVETLSFEAALTELETLVRTLESGQAPLEDAISAYERGVALKKQCETKLREAKEKVEKITVTQGGTVKAVPLDTQD